MRNMVPAYAIVRINEFFGESASYQEKIAVKEVVWGLQAAEAEVARLMALNAEKGVVYFLCPTRVQTLYDSQERTQQERKAKES